MFVNAPNSNATDYLSTFNETNHFFLLFPTANSYTKYVFFAICSALLGLPSNALLLVILIRIGLFSRRTPVCSHIFTRPTGSFERFLFEIVFIDTLLIIYHFVDNFLSYIHEDRSAGQHHLIHVSDFCCKFFTYIAKMSVLLTTWLLLFLIINQLILTMNYNYNHRSCWDRGLHYVNAKYSTVFLVFIFSVYNIYPIEVLKYYKKGDVQDYDTEQSIIGVCSMLEVKNKQLLNAMNYGYHIIGVAIPCVIILIFSLIIIYRTCRNHGYSSKQSISFRYIAGTIGIIHSLFNLPGRFSDILLMISPPYASFFPYLINFNHEAQSFLTLSYAYKCFICICISRRFRLHAKSVLCFLIENKYEDSHQIDIVNTSSEWQQLTKRKKYQQQNYHSRNSKKDVYLKKITLNKLNLKNISSLCISKHDLKRLATSETTYWIRPYFTQYEKRRLLRPCGRSSSCHQISTEILSSSSTTNTTKQNLPNSFDTSPSSSSPIRKNSFSSYIISINLPTGEYIHLPLPQKRAQKSSTSLMSKNLVNNRVHFIKSREVSENTENQSMNRINCLSSTYLY